MLELVLFSLHSYIHWYSCIHWDYFHVIDVGIRDYYQQFLEPCLVLFLYNYMNNLISTLKLYLCVDMNPINLVMR